LKGNEQARSDMQKTKSEIGQKKENKEKNLDQRKAKKDIDTSRFHG
jgi:hypothetical protein